MARRQGRDMYQLLSDSVLAIHFAFIAFVLLGGLFVLRQPRLAWLHLPAVVWGTIVEIMGLTCPLTPLENHFLKLAGKSAYRGDFISHYLLLMIYPEGLTLMLQRLLGMILMLLNLGIYTIVIVKLKR